MSDLENKLKALERQLAVQQAYLSVSHSFAKGNKIPQDVKDEVITALRSACASLAESGATVAQESVVFSEAEVSALKQIASAVMAKNESPAQTSVQVTPEVTKLNVTIHKPKNSGDIRKAKMLTTDSVPAQYRNKVTPDSTIYVKKSEGEKSMVVLPNGTMCWVDTEDLEFES